MKDYKWNRYQGDWRSSDIYRNDYWDYDPRDENYYLGRIPPEIRDYGNIDLDQRYYTDGSDRYYRNEEIRQGRGLPPNNYQLKDSHPYKNNDFYGERKRNYSWGPHRGKGPKNYIRSMERVREDASDRLTEDPFVDASKIEIWIKDNDLILSGTVETKFEKRRAEHLVESVPGAKHVQNNLRVAENKTTAPHTFG